jgi:UDP-GlcNAc:undecaprenyl-phosphate GlcNAc-1-phosphate transferase
VTPAESVVVSLAVATIVVYMTTPYVIALADRWQFYDLPAGYKGHLRPTPYLGGAAVMAGFAVSLLLAASDWGRTVPLVAGVGLLWVVGTVDDRRTVSPGLRVAVEAILGAIVWASGLGWHLHMGFAPDLSLTCVWVVAVVNAFNLFDNMDGAATTMALVGSAGAAVLGVTGDDTWLTIAAAGLGGACMGFLPRNLSRPARIFLGDGGSMPLGFAVSVLAMAGAAATAVPWRALVVGFLLVGIPALDSCLVVVSRRRRGVPVLTGGRDHLTHRVSRFLPGSRAVALSLGAVQAGACGLAVLASKGSSAFVVFSAVLYLAVAGSAICVFDNRPVEEIVISESDSPPRSQRTAPAWSAVVVLGVLGLGAGLSPFVAAFYDATTWVPIGLGLVVLAAISQVARPGRVRGPAALALGGLLGLGVWSLSSAAWAESVESAVVDGNRMLVYGALLIALLTLVRSERRSTWLLGALAAGAIAVAVSVLVRLLAEDPGSLFLLGRLNSPVGYINGEGCLFVMGFWLCWTAAEDERPVVAGVAAGAATLMACLSLLSQSRGTALAMAVSLVVVVAVVPARRRRLYGLLCAAAGVALSRKPLLAVYHYGLAGQLPVGVGHAAGRAALLAALGVGIAWFVAGVARRRLVATGTTLAGRVDRTATGLLVVAAAAAVIAAGASAPRIEQTVRSQWYAFTHLVEPANASLGASQSRLLSGTGNRYDYWRVAWKVWREHPLIGVGAGNYERPYFVDRSTTEDIDQPHSLELQTLSELGLVGAALLLMLVAGLAMGVRRMRRDAGRSEASRALLIGALGTTVAWFTQTSGDWIHLLPGVTAIALGAMAVLVCGRGDADPIRPAGHRARRSGIPAGPRVIVHRRWAAALAGAALAAALVIAGASLSREGLGDLFRARAESALDAHPADALSEANRSLSIDSDAMETYYVKAAALARFDEAGAAQATLRAALRHEPDNFITWTLLGDIAEREGRFGVAKGDYVTAHALNPRDPSLRALSANPRAAAQ